jgi:hypothetical protein
MATFERLIRAHRIFNTEVGAGGVRPNSHAVVSLTEMGRSNPAGPLDTPFLGGASMKVYNVAPGIDRVFVRGEIDWDDDLDIRVTVLVE